MTFAKHYTLGNHFIHSPLNYSSPIILLQETRTNYEINTLNSETCKSRQGHMNLTNTHVHLQSFDS